MDTQTSQDVMNLLTELNEQALLIVLVTRTRHRYANETDHPGSRRVRGERTIAILVQSYAQSVY